MDVLCPHKKEKKIITNSNREGKKEEPIYSILEPIPEPKVPTLYKVMIFLCGPTNGKKTVTTNACRAGILQKQVGMIPQYNMQQWGGIKLLCTWCYLNRWSCTAFVL